MKEEPPRISAGECQKPSSGKPGAGEKTPREVPGDISTTLCFRVGDQEKRIFFVNEL
jgi:hypothetical protein